MANLSQDLLERAQRIGLISRDDFEQVFLTISKMRGGSTLNTAEAATRVAEQLQTRGVLTCIKQRLWAKGGWSRWEHQSTQARWTKCAR